jgi:hypothetical protein
MSGILFPDMAGALSAGASAAHAGQQARFLEEDRAAKNEITPLIPLALGGDRDALGKIATRHPKTAMELAPLLERMDTNQRTKVKEATDWTTRAAMGVLSLPENERPAAYQAALADGQRLGYKIDMPPQYDRAVEGRLKHILNQARPIADYWKNQDEGVTLVPSGGGGGAAPGGFTGQVAKDESGGNYNIPNAKGSGAYGKYQFMPDTWASVAQSNPQLNLPMNMRQATPQQQEAAMEAFTRMNGQQLAQSGVPATPSNLYLAHRFGAAGATRFLSAPDNTPIAQVFPANWIQQNPDLNTTVGQFKRGVQSRYGGIPAGREVNVADNSAPMPQPPGGMAVPGTPAPMPQPPGLAQGDAAPRGDASGNPIQTSDGGMVPRESVKMIAPDLPPGTFLGKDRKTGKFMVQEGNFVVYDNNRNPVGLIPVPKPKEQGTGPFKGTGAEVQGLNMLIANGTLTPQQAAELAAGKTITDPKTGVVVFMTPTGIMGQAPNGQTAPIPIPGVAAPAPAAAPAPSAAPGTPAPAGAPQAAPATRAGVIPLTSAKPETMTESQAKAYGFSQRMATANSLLDDLAIQGTSKRGRFLEGLPGGLGNLAQTPEFQRFEQAKRNFMNAQLRDESGAVIGPSEFMSADLQYFPQPGQEMNKQLHAQMAENRRQVVEAMMVKAGVLKRGERYEPPAKTVDPAEKGRLLFEARKALDEGRDPNGVREKLKKLGVDPAELDPK